MGDIIHYISTYVRKMNSAEKAAESAEHNKHRHLRGSTTPLGGAWPIRFINSIAWSGSLITTLLATSASLLPASPAIAAGSADAQATQLEEIVVTAQKRSESLQKTPAAVTAVSGDAILKQGLQDPRSLSQVVPSLSIGAGGADPAIYFRGVGQTINSENTDSGVAVNLNGVYEPRQFILRSMFDVHQVEALPGPQGTLYGSNSIGGTVNIKTNLPSNRLEGDALLEGGNYGTFHASGAVTLPLTDDVSTRAAIDYSRHDGYYSNGGGNQDTLAARLTTRYQPNDQLSATLFLNYFHDFTLNGPYVNHPYYDSSDPWYFPANPNPADFHSGGTGYLVSGDITYHFSNLVLTYTPGWSYVDTKYNSIASSVLYVDIAEHAHQNTQEIRLANDDNGRSKWVVGLYYFNSSSYQNLNVHVPNPPVTVQIAQPVSTDEISYAGFGQYTYSVQPWLRLTAGGRYSYNSKAGSAATNMSLHLPDGSILPLSSDSLSGFDHIWRHFDWKLGAEADLGDHSMVYASVATGFLNGGFAVPPLPPGGSTVIEPEKLLGFTIGTKNRFFDNRLQFNNEFFYYDYKNYQLATLYLPTNQTSFYNAKKAVIYGAQFDVVFRLTPNDRLTANVGLLHPEAVDFNLGAAAGDFSGYQLPNAPYATIHLGFEHDWQLDSGATVNASIHSNYDSGQWVTFNHYPETHSPAYTKTDLALTYNSPKGWALGAFVRNIENSAYFKYAQTGTIPGPAAVDLQPPRTFGVRFNMHFDPKS